MNTSGENSIAGASGDFEETLRLVARLAPPEGLEERVQAGLKAAPASDGARILAWPVAQWAEGSWLGSPLVRSAAAAAIVAVVLGGSWGVYSRVQSIQPVRAITLPLHLSTQGGFSSSGAMRTPQTLNGPKVENPTAAHPATTALIPASKPATKTPLHPAKAGLTDKAVAPLAVPQVR